jgi:hypothetical protein
LTVSTGVIVGATERGKRKGLEDRGVGDFISVSGGDSFSLGCGGGCGGGCMDLSSEGGVVEGVGLLVVVACVRKGFSLRYPSSICVARFSSQGLNVEPS